MTDVTIPDAAVEAAAMIIGGWDGRGEPFRHEMWRRDARHVLAAAAPYIAAQALRDAADEDFTTESGIRRVGYLRLRDRADQIEAGNG